MTIQILITIAIGAIFINQYGYNFGIYLTEPSASRYGEIALVIMENGINANSKEWIEFKDRAIDEIENSTSYEEVYPIIEEASKALLPLSPNVDLGGSRAFKFLHSL